MAETGTQLIERVFDIVELLVTEEQGLGVTQIADQLELNKTTVHRIVNAILQRGYIEKSQQGRYRLGLKFVALCSHRLNNLELTTEAKPFLTDLTAKLGQSSHLAILDGVEAVYIDKVEVVRNLRLYSQIGKRIPIYNSALGKSLLLDKTDEQLFTLLNNCQYQLSTKYTLTSPEEVIKQIKKGKKEGWTIDDQEHDLGIRCFAAPVYDYTGNIIAAISTSGPDSLFTLDREAEIGSMVSDAALRISERLGFWKK